ncbi:hypothetical protein [Rhizorhabdus sp.]|uniref:hypothetical protein n=1 Tax=Rhizorhabdus sp. TaxID=1968843 RepID=UPI0035B273AD
MDRIEQVLEKQLAHLRKMIAMIETGEVQVQSEGRDIGEVLGLEYREQEAELSNALERHRLRLTAGLQPNR